MIFPIRDQSKIGALNGALNDSILCKWGVVIVTSRKKPVLTIQPVASGKSVDAVFKAHRDHLIIPLRAGDYDDPFINEVDAGEVIYER